MKKVLLSILVAFVGIASVNAQGLDQKWIGGSTSLWSSKVSGGDRVTNFKINPEFGFVVSDRLGVGFELGYAHEQMNFSDAYDDYTIKANSYKIAPFARMALFSSEIGGVFIDGGAGYSYGRVIGGGPDVHTVEAGFRPGISVNIAESVSLIGKIGFIGYEYQKMGSLKKNDFGFNFDMSDMQVGAIFKF